MSVPHKRLLQVFAVLAAWAIVVVARLVQVQLVRHDEYTNRAVKQQERTLELSPVRGQILDARGRVLAESVAAQSIYADPQAIANRRAVAARLAPILHIPARDIESKLDSDAGFVWIARQVPLEVAARVKQLAINGISFIDDHRRAYPRGSLAASVIGYVGVDGEGLSGVEHSFDSQVRGRAGRVTVLRDARRGMYLVGGEGLNRPVDGNDVVLTIDSVVQFITERALAKAVDKYHALGGSAIVMDARNGDVLAMASYPTFDPNHFRDYAASSWRNRNVQEIYEPGSTFKIVTASAAIEERVVTPSQILDCGNGAIQVADVLIHEHGGNHYGLMTFEDVLVHSSNVGTVRVALALGERRLYDYVRRFGFGQRTNIQLPGEASGLLRRLSHWSDVSVASIAIGQEIGVTPLQLVRAIATVANGGLRIEPRIIDRVVDNSGATIYTPEVVTPKRVISERTAAVLNELLKSVVYRGTGERAALPEHVVAGKTGTAQKAVRGGYAIDKFIASFGGYVPADRPRLVILVVVDEPRHEQYGGVIAAPAFREIAEATLQYLKVAPSVPQRSISLDAPLLAAFSQQPNPAPRSGVPDLKGLDARAAVAKATAAGLVVDAIGSGVVTTQHPQAGEAMPGDRHVSITLAEGGR